MKIFILFSIILVLLSSAPLAKAELLVGWWADLANQDQFPTWASYGVNFVHFNWCLAGYRNAPSVYSIANIKSFLDAAQANGIKVSIAANADDPGIDSEHTAWPTTASGFTSFLNNFKNHSALWGWYLADEPELASNPTLGYTYLSTNPGYYPLAKATDPVHYAWLVNSGAIATAWNDVRDLFAIDLYPKSNTSSEFGDSQLRQSYDFWMNGFTLAKANNKLPFLVLVQGMGIGYGDYGDLTTDELRYHVFSPIVQGIDKVLFWTYTETNATMASRVNQTIAQIMAVKTEMQNGITNDPRITVSQPHTSLTYRYGANGTSNVILAVNIANRNSISGSTLSNVQFNLAPGVRPTEVEVIGENRTLPVSNGVFTDTFNRFEVHLYRFITSSAFTPPSPPKGLRVR